MIVKYVGGSIQFSAWIGGSIQVLAGTWNGSERSAVHLLTKDRDRTAVPILTKDRDCTALHKILERGHDCL